MVENPLQWAARAVYSGALWLGQPLLRIKLARRAKAEPGYAHAVQERFGFYDQPASGHAWVWVHAVSLGETRTAAVWVAALRQVQPGVRVLWTHGTATGWAEGQRHLHPGDAQTWQPWDTPGAVTRFLAHWQPRALLLMETEIWPNLMAACQQIGVPVMLLNARLSAKTHQQSQRWLLSLLARPAYARLHAALAQTDADAQRLASLGAPVAAITGNLKFDAQANPAQIELAQRWRGAAPRRRVALLASSREGEEALWCSALAQSFKEKTAVGPNLSAEAATKNVAIADAASVQWLLVPRHPQRFDEVAALLAQQLAPLGIGVQRRSSWSHGGPPDDATAPTVWLGDSLGEMTLYAALADVALLGGSFEPLGGQNLIELCATGCPVVMGPHTFNFAQAADDALAAGAALRVDGVAQAIDAAANLVHDEPALAGHRRAALQFAQAHRGATQRTLGHVMAVLGGLPAALP